LPPSLASSPFHKKYATSLPLAFAGYRHIFFATPSLSPFVRRRRLYCHYAFDTSYGIRLVTPFSSVYHATTPLKAIIAAIHIDTMLISWLNWPLG